MLACVRDKKIVGAFHVVVEPGVDFYSAFRASEFHPLEVLQIEADCSRVNQPAYRTIPRLIPYFQVYTT